MMSSVREFVISKLLTIRGNNCLDTGRSVSYQMSLLMALRFKSFQLEV